MSKLTPEMANALLGGSAFDLRIPRDYALQVEVSDINKTAVTLRVLVVDSKTRIPVMEVARERLNNGDTLTMANIQRAFELRWRDNE